MSSTQVYSPTTASKPRPSWFLVPSEHLDQRRFGIKLCEVLLSLVAFVLEEQLTVCVRCSALYVFEFVSCVAFLFTLLLLILLATPLHAWASAACWRRLDLVYSVCAALLFIISSSVLAAVNSGTGLEKSAAAFGFVASLAFILDAIFLWRSRVSPFWTDLKEEAGQGVVAAQAPPPEAEPLSMAAEAAE